MSKLITPILMTFLNFYVPIILSTASPKAFAHLHICTFSNCQKASFSAKNIPDDP